jgi:hypothetical protein
MTDRSWQYYAALVASAVSVAGWLGAVAGLVLTVSAVATGGAVGDPAVLTVLALATGIVFARVEKRLYRADGR